MFGHSRTRVGDSSQLFLAFSKRGTDQGVPAGPVGKPKLRIFSGRLMAARLRLSATGPSAPLAVVGRAKGGELTSGVAIRTMRE